MLFGDCHVPRNDGGVKGLAEVLGGEVPICGGAARQGRSYFQGKIVEKSNVALLLAGDFTCGVGLKRDMSREGLINSARDVCRDAIGPDKEKALLILVFDCGGRRVEMLKLGNFPSELEAMKQAAGNCPLFGFYGSGEIGCTGVGEAPCGVGHHIAACAIRSR